MPLLLLTHHVIPWVFEKAAEFIRSQLGQSQSPDPTEGLESQTEIEQNAAEQPTSATERNASELPAVESDPTQSELGDDLPELRGLDLMMEGQKEVQKPAGWSKLAKDAGDAVKLEVGQMNSSIFLSSDFPPLQREKFEKKSQKTDVTPGPKMGRISKTKIVRRIVFGSHFMIPDNLKMPIEVRKYRPDPVPRPWAAKGPKRQSVLATKPQPPTPSVAAAAAS